MASTGVQAEEIDVVIEPGADFLEVFTYSGTDSDGSAFDFSSGWTGAAQVRRYYGAPGSPLLTFTVTLTTAGKVTLTAAASLTTAVTTGGVWDLELTKTSGGRIIRLIRGRAVLSKQVTA